MNDLPRLHSDVTIRVEIQGLQREKAELNRRLNDALEKIRVLEKERVAIQENSRVVTCVFCGYEYPPDTPTSNHEMLKKHVAKCPEHPMFEVVKRADMLERYVDASRETGLKFLTDEDIEQKGKQAAVGEFPVPQARLIACELAFRKMPCGDA